jgi:ribonucleotide monophosphatase NagD (HAD superfamily)
MYRQQTSVTSDLKMQATARRTMEFKGVIFDINGVLEFQGVVCPGAIELFDLLCSKGIIIRNFLTNSTFKSRQDCAFKLNRMGFNVNAVHISKTSLAQTVTPVKTGVQTFSN